MRSRSPFSGDAARTGARLPRAKSAFRFTRSVALEKLCVLAAYTISRAPATKRDAPASQTIPARGCGGCETARTAGWERAAVQLRVTATAAPSLSPSAPPRALQRFSVVPDGWRLLVAGFHAVRGGTPSARRRRTPPGPSWDRAGNRYRALPGRDEPWDRPAIAAMLPETDRARRAAGELSRFRSIGAR